MHADQTLETLCRRHGVDLSFGERLLPLLRRAASAAPDVRERLLGLVEQSLAREAERRAELDRNRAARDDQSLMNVARALHAWNPPEKFDADGYDPERLDPEGEDESQDPLGGFDLGLGDL